MNASDDNASSHRETWDLIPWIVNGRCQEQERRSAEEHLAVCADCRAELAFQRNIYMALRCELEQDTRAPVTASNKPWYGGRWLVQGLVATVAVEAVGLAMLGAALWPHSGQGAHYQTLSAPAVAVQQATIRAVFAPTLMLAAMQALLAQEHLQIVAGPGDAGVYTLAPLVAQPDDAFAETLKRLRAQPGVVFAEPIKPGG